jgi:rhamnose utilization protein RhaD (predicted bifunctional aldolase and dehydrogenase)
LPSRWNPEEAARYADALALRSHTSRLLGTDPFLVLHGGGNTSVKLREPSLADGEEILYVKGSGSDLATVGPSDFTPLRLRAVRALLEGDELEVAEMFARLDEMIVHRPSPKPSVESLLHAALPARYVEHTHADAILAIGNTENGERILGGLYGDLAPTVPYRHSGFGLAKACAETCRDRATDRTIGLILQFHGAVAFADSARESYENMIRLVEMAEAYLDGRGAWTLPAEKVNGPLADRLELSSIRRRLSLAAGFPLLMTVMRDPFAMHFARRPDLPELGSHGPATPQHVIFGRRVPLLGDDVARYIASYRAYLAGSLACSDAQRLDPSPRIVVRPEVGVCALGVSARYARIAAEIFRHDMEIMVRAQAHDSYRAAPATLMAHAELDYSGFEARERLLAASERPFLGQVAAFTADAARRAPERVLGMLRQGCAVAIAGEWEARGVDAGDALKLFPSACETPSSWDAFLDDLVCTFGGLDLLVTTDEEVGFAERSAALLALSPVEGRTEQLGAPLPAAG